MVYVLLCGCTVPGNRSLNLNCNDYHQEAATQSLSAGYYILEAGTVAVKLPAPFTLSGRDTGSAQTAEPLAPSQTAPSVPAFWGGNRAHPTLCTRIAET